MRDETFPCVSDSVKESLVEYWMGDSWKFRLTIKLVNKMLFKVADEPCS